jgi:hypothetical protein
MYVTKTAAFGKLLEETQGRLDGRYWKKGLSLYGLGREPWQGVIIRSG